MPTSTAARGSTADGTNGVAVAQATNEVGGSPSPILQSIVPEGNKTTYSEASRTGITSADAPTGGDMTTTGFAGSSGANLFDIGNALALSIRATCGTASKVLTGRVAFYDGSNNCLSMSEVISFTSDGTLRLGNASGDFIAARSLIDAGQARKARFFVDSVSGGTWAIYCRPI